MSDAPLPAALGAYEVLCRLSRGGMGEVLLGRRRGAHGFERLVALKLVLATPREAVDTRVMFLDEARLAARLTHPAVAQVYDFGEEAGQLWLAMEYVAGVAFNQLARAPAAVCAQLVAEACRGLHAAHELADGAGRPLKVVHRDISPDNLRLGFDGQVKVIDFGVALVRDREQPVTQAGFIKGKLRYMSPEQVRGDVLDRRADVYALGVVLHELLTGEPMMGDGVALEALGNRPRKIAAPASALPGLDAVVMKALADRPEDRYASALELREALLAVAPGASLERFAAEALAGKALEHRAWLQAVLAGVEPTSPGKPGAATPRLTVPDEAAPPVTEKEAAPRRSRWAVRALLAVVVASAGYWVSRGEVPVPVPVAPPPPVVSAVTVDAGAASAVDLTIGEAALDQTARTPRPKPARPVKPAEIAAAPPSGSGTVQVVAAGDAYGVVRIDGEVIGPTPQKVKLSAGRHLVEVLRPDTNAVQFSQRIELADGQVRRIAAE